MHALWSTKRRMPLITTEIEHDLHEQLRQELLKLHCEPYAVNGMSDHVHCLFQLNPKLKIIDIMKQIKVSSAHYLNHHYEIDHVIWQRGYLAFSVSKGVLPTVKRYIEHQKSHHEK
ncbi:MAG: IS200/IS605 family transposase [Flavobacteriales bacterium]